MRLLLITTFVTFLVFHSIAKSVKNVKCPRINRSTKIDFLFPENVFWRIYAYSDPGMKTLSLFTLHETQVDLKLNCIKFQSLTELGVTMMSHNCFAINNSTWVLDSIKIFLKKSKQKSYYKELFRNSEHRQFSDITILDTDQESFITFYGCEKLNGLVLEGILILIREEKFVNFNESKLELSYELLKPSFGYKFVEEIDDENRSRKCECNKLYRDVYNSDQANTIILDKRRKKMQSDKERTVKGPNQKRLLYLLGSIFGFFSLLIILFEILQLKCKL